MCANPHLSGVGLSYIVRWLGHIPTGVVAFEAFSLLDKGLQQGLAESSQGRDLLKSLRLMQYTGFVMFIWNFAMFVAPFFLSEFDLGILGIVDVVLASLLAAGVAGMSSHLPESSFSCRPDILGKQPSNPAHTGDFCHTMFTEKILTIIVVVLYAICGIINLSVVWSWLRNALGIKSPTSVGDAYAAVRKRIYGLELWNWRPSFGWAYKTKHGVMGWALVDGDDDETVVDDDFDGEALLGHVELTAIVADGGDKSYKELRD
ncbi:unnamed protein product [Clonostachys rosea]|uniref:Uncharacterized protein n=1 Tax=Bionectria ochroleuca TaxID=29856 RepID=A0ABY6V5V6_BIOOC|nr:unnamed protein product [Clonostachys rosea]